MPAPPERRKIFAQRRGEAAGAEPRRGARQDAAGAAGREALHLSLPGRARPRGGAIGLGAAPGPGGGERSPGRGCGAPRDGGGGGAARRGAGTHPAGLPSLQVTEALCRRCRRRSCGSAWAEQGYSDCARLLTCAMKLSMLPSTAVKSSGKLSAGAAAAVASPRSRAAGPRRRQPFLPSPPGPACSNPSSSRRCTAAVPIAARRHPPRAAAAASPRCRATPPALRRAPPSRPRGRGSAAGGEGSADGAGSAGRLPAQEPAARSQAASMTEGHGVRGERAGGAASPGAAWGSSRPAPALPCPPPPRSEAEGAGGLRRARRTGTASRRRSAGPSPAPRRHRRPSGWRRDRGRRRLRTSSPAGRPFGQGRARGAGPLGGPDGAARPRTCRPRRRRRRPRPAPLPPTPRNPAAAPPRPRGVVLLAPRPREETSPSRARSRIRRGRSPSRVSRCRPERSPAPTCGALEEREAVVSPEKAALRSVWAAGAGGCEPGNKGARRGPAVLTGDVGGGCPHGVGSAPPAPSRLGTPKDFSCRSPRLPAWGGGSAGSSPWLFRSVVTFTVSFKKNSGQKATLSIC